MGYRLDMLLALHQLNQHGYTSNGNPQPYKGRLLDTRLPIDDKSEGNSADGKTPRNACIDLPKNFYRALSFALSLAGSCIPASSSIIPNMSTFRPFSSWGYVRTKVRSAASSMCHCLIPPASGRSPWW